MSKGALSWDLLKLHLPHVRQRKGVVRAWLTKEGMRFGDYLEEWPIAGVLTALSWSRLMLDHGQPVCWTLANGKPRPESNRRGPPKWHDCAGCDFRKWEYSAPCRKYAAPGLVEFLG